MGQSVCPVAGGVPRALPADGVDRSTGVQALDEVGVGGEGPAEGDEAGGGGPGAAEPGAVRGGLCGSQIAELPPCVRDGDGGPSETAEALLVSEPTVERDRADLMIEDLRRSRTLLDAVVAAAEPIRGAP